MTITANEAQNLFTRLRGITREGEKIIIAIIEQRAWEPLGYPSLAAAWDQEIGNDVILMTKNVKQAVLREAITSGTIDNLPKIRGLGGYSVQRFLDQVARGVPVEIADINSDFWGEELLELLSGDEPPEGWSLTWWQRAQESFFLHQQTPNGRPVKWVQPENKAKYRDARPGIIEKVKVRRRATTANLPGKPNTIHIHVGEAEYERITRVLSAAGKFPNEELKRVIMAHVDLLESELKVGV